MKIKKVGYTVIELNKGDKIVFADGFEDKINKPSIVLQRTDFDFYRRDMENDRKLEIIKKWFPNLK